VDAFESINAGAAHGADRRSKWDDERQSGPGVVSPLDLLAQVLGLWAAYEYVRQPA
jgi:hypothetical protein